MTAAVPAWASDRVALVVGNSSYPKSPLYNPENDARDMAKLLRQAGFQVTTRTNATKSDLQRAVADFGQAITAPSIKIAVFYYAGHGVQLDWRNYLIPVDANPRSADELRAQSLDVSALLAYMQRAQQKDRSFLVVLDACRDDPFAGTYRPELKGLSQFDAPVGALLAYATAPGRVALDGTVGGTNGLYTAYLLQELAKKGTPIEDAFKRTRLNVRLASNGQQVPWESTSLEDDVYLFPTERKKPTDREQILQMDTELQAWSKVRGSSDPFEIAGFLRDYPSGNFSELATNRMNYLFSLQSGAESMRLVAKNLAVEESKKVQAAREQAEADRLNRIKEAQLAEDAAKAASQLLAQQAREAQAAKLAEQQALARAEEAQRQERERAAEARAQADKQRLAQIAFAAAEAAKLEAQRIAEAQRAALAAAAQLAEQTAAIAREAAARELARQEAARVAAAHAEAQRVEAAKAEANRIAEAARQAAQQEAVAREAARVAAEKAAAEQAAQLRLETLRAAEAKEKADAAERARLAALEAERASAEAERVARAQAAQEREEANKLAEAKAAAERAEAVRLTKLAAEAAASQQAAQAQAAVQIAQNAVAGLSQAVRIALEKVQAADLATPATAASHQPIAVTPYFRGAQEFQRQYALGDRYEFKVVDLFNRSERPLVMQVSAVDPNRDRVEYNNGEYVSDSMGNILTNLRGTSSTPRQFYPAELFVGKRWKTLFRQVRPNGTSYTFRYDMRVVARERITVPAGTFDTFKIEGRGFNMELGASLERNIWVAPGLGADVVLETNVRLSNGRWDQRERQELISVQTQPRANVVPSNSLSTALLIQR